MYIGAKLPMTNDEEVNSDKVDEGDAKTGDVQVSIPNTCLYSIVFQYRGQ